MMPKPFTPKVVSANDLLRGDVVYQTQTGWTRDLEAAEVLTDEAHADLRLIEASTRSQRVVGAYLADVQISEGVARTPHYRDAIRANGPTIALPSAAHPHYRGL